MVAFTISLFRPKVLLFGFIPREYVALTYFIEDREMSTKKMPAKKNRSSQQADALQLFRGKAPPRNIAQQAIAAMHAQRNAETEKGNSNQRQMAKHFELVQQTPSINAKDPSVSRSLEGLLALHQKFAKQKLLAPKVPEDVGGILPGRISANVVAPFDFDHVLFGTGTNSNIATREATANRQNGQINLSAITIPNKGFGGGSAYGVVGLYFHPIGSGVLTFRAAPKYSYQWWTNSIRPTALVKSHGHISLVIYGVDAYAGTTGEVATIKSVASTNLLLWNEEETNQVRFDFKFDLQTSGSVSMNVNHTLVYYMFVEAQVGVHSVGWPGSLAGSKLSVTVPSIAYDYELHPILQQ
jgi:hypothetical protein